MRLLRIAAGGVSALILVAGVMVALKGSRAASARAKEKEDIQRLLRDVVSKSKWNTLKELSDNPLAMIRAVNALKRRGRQGALKALKYDYSVANGDVPIMWVGNLLYGEKGTIAPGIGFIHPEKPKGLKAPRFPVVLEGGIPYVLYTGRDLNGFPEPLAMYLDALDGRCVFDSKPLAPPDDPFPVLKRVMAMGFAFEQREELLRQTLRLVGEVFKPDIWVSGEVLRTDFDVDVDKLRRDFLKLRARWDPKTDSYVVPSRF